MMLITVQFYSQLREIVGAAEISLRLAEQTTIADLLRQLYCAHPGLEKWDGNILLGVGLGLIAVCRPSVRKGDKRKWWA